MTALVGVYRDRRTAEEVAEALTEVGAEPGAVRVADAKDLEALHAEMEAEVAEGGFPFLGAFMTREMVHGAVIFGLALGAIGLVIGLIFAAIVDFGPWGLTGRLVVGGVVGALFAGTVGTILGGGLGMKSPEDRPAAEQGVTVRVEDGSPKAEEVMAEHAPIRLDRIAGESNTTTISTDGDPAITETLREFRDNVRDPRRQG
jgi:hypothetical protein